MMSQHCGVDTVNTLVTQPWFLLKMPSKFAPRVGDKFK